ncbi:MAG: hypothetical protein FWH21_08685, partial [Kiritimatiellaeota bacterium]|nr:hypothetical protein [Kiritimatiellota bacterium]
MNENFAERSADFPVRFVYSELTLKVFHSYIPLGMYLSVEKRPPPCPQGKGPPSAQARPMGHGMRLKEASRWDAMIFL